MGLRSLKRSAAKHPNIWGEDCRFRLLGKIKPLRDIEDTAEVWKEWKLSSLWQQHVFELLRKNDSKSLFDFSGIRQIPLGLLPTLFYRDLSLFILLFLYCEIPYQMGVYEISLYHRKIGKVPNLLNGYEISSEPQRENPLFSKMRAPTGLRNFAMKYIEFAFHIQRVDFKSKYQKHRLIYCLLKELFPRKPAALDQMGLLQQDHIRNYLKGAEEKYTLSNAAAITNMVSGFCGTKAILLSDLEEKHSSPIFTPNNLPIYYYLDEHLRLGHCACTLDDFFFFHHSLRERLDEESSPALWLEYEKTPPPTGYLT